MTPLHQQEHMLRENLASEALSGEQRRVQVRLLRATQRDLALDKRFRQAIEAGYEPFEPSEDWRWGYVEDPRFLHGHIRLASALLAVPLGGALGFGAIAAWHVDLLASLATALVLALGLYAVLHNVIGWQAERATTLALASQATAVDGALIFNSAMPPDAVVAYRRAREGGLFDTFVVYSPRAEDFRSVQAYKAPSLGLLDPVLAGLIGGRRLLIAQWDLARDLS